MFCTIKIYTWQFMEIFPRFKKSLTQNSATSLPNRVQGRVPQRARLCAAYCEARVCLTYRARWWAGLAGHGSSCWCHLNFLLFTFIYTSWVHVRCHGTDIYLFLYVSTPNHFSFCRCDESIVTSRRHALALPPYILSMISVFFLTCYRQCPFHHGDLSPTSSPFVTVAYPVHPLSSPPIAGWRCGASIYMRWTPDGMPHRRSPPSIRS